METRQSGAASLSGPRIPLDDMEHLWSRAGANGGEPAQSQLGRKRLNQAESVAYGCR